jgi:hypothetical protein
VVDAGVDFLGIAKGPTCDGPYDRNAYIFCFSSVGVSYIDEFVVTLGPAFRQCAWSGSTTVNLRAGWFGDTDHGLAVVTMSTYQFLPYGSAVEDDNEISFVIDPTAYRGASNPPRVATASVNVGAGGNVTITVTL